MQTAEILDGLGKSGRFPIEAVEAARANRTIIVPAFLDLIERCQSEHSPSDKDALFLAFHLLGEWREKAAYRPAARPIRLPTVYSFLGEAITGTSHRVMAALFDGDPDPLYQIVRDPKADSFVRSRMCEAL